MQIIETFHTLRPRVVKVISKLVELVERKIKAAVNLFKANHCRRAILYDGWDGGSEHYVGLFLSSTHQVIVRQLGEEILVGIPHIVLLSCSPMNHKGEDGGELTEAVMFNAEQHIEFFDAALAYYDLTISDRFITNQIADNASVNKKVARLLGI
jgi:hypothetical protein